VAIGAVRGRDVAEGEHLIALAIAAYRCDKRAAAATDEGYRTEAEMVARAFRQFIRQACDAVVAESDARQARIQAAMGKSD